MRGGRGYVREWAGLCQRVGGVSTEDGRIMWKGAGLCQRVELVMLL